MSNNTIHSIDNGYGEVHQLAVTDDETEVKLGVGAITKATNSTITKIGSYVFNYCTKLTDVSFPNVTSIGVSAFYACSNLAGIYLFGSSVPTLASSDAFSKITGYAILVKSSMYSDFCSANVWSQIKSSIFAYCENPNPILPNCTNIKTCYGEVISID